MPVQYENDHGFPKLPPSLIFANWALSWLFLGNIAGRFNVAFSAALNSELSFS